MSKISSLGKLVEKGLAELIIPEKPGSLYDPIRYTLNLGGKRLRPQLVLMGAGLAGGQPEKALKAAMAIELLHNFTLIHDDIMDDAGTRRGKPSVHTKWDNSTAILSGDAMFALAYEQLQYYTQENGFSESMYPELMKLFNRAVLVVCEGQALDLEFETALDVTQGQYLHMIGCKTAALLETSLVMGGVVAGANPQQRKHLAVIGKEAGLAFQIQDDLLDAIGDPEKFGKHPGGDIYEGKKTWLTISALEKANNQQKNEIVRVLQNSKCTENEVAYVIGMFHELGVISDTREAIKNRYLSGLQALNHFSDNPYAQAVKDLLSKLKTRES